MKYNKVIIFLIIIAIVIFTLSILIIYKFKNIQTYELNIPELYEINDISLESDKGSITFNVINTLRDIINIFNSNNHKTKKISTNDSPINARNKIQVLFNHKDGKANCVFIYEKNNKYYIEQPYNGVYKISANEYNIIHNYLNNKILYK